MKSKVNLVMTYLLMTLILTGMSNCNNSPKNTSSENQIKDFKNESNEEEKIINTIKNYYKSYIIETIPGKVSPNKMVEIIDSIHNKYCSKQLLDLLGKLTYDDLDYDPFLESQMVDTRMLDKLTVSKDKNKENLYYVTYIYGDYHPTIELTMIKEGDNYKINSLPRLDKHLVTNDSLKKANNW